MADHTSEQEKLGQTQLSLANIAKGLDLTLLTEAVDFASVFPSAGYTSDMLSYVMANAARQGLWVTLQAHANIIAIAALLELTAIIITEGAMPDPSTIALANQKGITLFSTPQPSFSVVGKLWEMGLRAE